MALRSCLGAASEFVMLHRQPAPVFRQSAFPIGRLLRHSMQMRSSPTAEVRGGSKLRDPRRSASPSYDFFAKSKPTVTQARCSMSPDLDV